MKNLVRAFVLSLVATGAVASLHINASASTVPTTSVSYAPPVPICPPNDPTGCTGNANGQTNP